MKPDKPVARKQDYTVQRTQHSLVAKLIQEHHYARACANTSVLSAGLWRAGTLVGGCLWMPPTARAGKGLAREWLGSPARHREVLVLSRLVVAPGEPQNCASILLAGAERLLRSDERWSLLVTYADEGQGHEGTIYKATNWLPAGTTVPTRTWVDPSTGRQVAQKALRTRTLAEMRALGLTERVSCKKRFVKLVRKR